MAMDHLPSQIREQLEAQKEQCVFCRILKGEIPSQRVYEDDLVAMLLDINPAAPGHALLVPREHYPILPLVSPEEFDRLFGLMPQFADAMRRGVLCDSVTVFLANGAAAGQQSPHVIAHLIPRERGDGLENFEFPHRSIDESALPTLLGPVREALAGQIGARPVEGGFLASERVVIERAPREQALGHLVIRSARGARLTALSFVESAELFRAASIASSLLFEGLGSEATNIIGLDREGLEIHVIPRRSDDGLELLWEPMKQPPDPGEVAGKLSKALFDVQVRVEKGRFDLPGVAEAPEPSAPAGQPPPAASVRERIDAAFEALKRKPL